MPTSYDSAARGAGSSRRAGEAHGPPHEAKTGRPDPDWTETFAQYIVQERWGRQDPSGGSGATP